MGTSWNSRSHRNTLQAPLRYSRRQTKLCNCYYLTPEQLPSYHKTLSYVAVETHEKHATMRYHLGFSHFQTNSSILKTWYALQAIYAKTQHRICSSCQLSDPGPIHKQTTILHHNSAIANSLIFYSLSCGSFIWSMPSTATKLPKHQKPKIYSRSSTAVRWFANPEEWLAPEVMAQ